VKLTDDAVMEIRAAYATGGISQRQLEAAYGVARRTIRDAVSGISFKHLPLVAYGPDVAPPVAEKLLERGILLRDSGFRRRPAGHAFTRKLLSKWVALRSTTRPPFGSWIKAHDDPAVSDNDRDEDGSTKLFIEHDFESGHDVTVSSFAIRASRYYEATGRPTSGTPDGPSEALCWILTFEIILKKLTPVEYRALASWYRDPESADPSEAVEAIRYECKVRRFE
jgi:hypothetical protein